jgi:hypothetical protein
MPPTPHVSFTARKFGAWVCLLAVVLLWTPLWATAWQTNAMACCSDGLCPARGLRHMKAGQTEGQAPAPPETSTDCEHHSAKNGQSGLMKCSISCCHETATSFTTGVVFVLPPSAILSHPWPVAASPVIVSASKFAWPIEPLSPPPRNSQFSA